MGKGRAAALKNVVHEVAVVNPITDAGGRIPISARKLSQSEWEQVFTQAREMTRQAGLDNAMRAVKMAPEMLELLADCARGINTFAGASHAVRRMAAQDVLEIATGGIEREAWRDRTEKATNINELDLGEVQAFIEAGRERLRRMREKGVENCPVDTEPP